MENIHQYLQLAATYMTEMGTKVLAVILFWLVGRWLIGLVGKMLQRVLEKQKVDPTLMRYLGNFVAVTLNIALVVAILGYCGFQTTTFAALVAGIGIAIGAAGVDFFQTWQPVSSWLCCTHSSGRFHNRRRHPGADAGTVGHGSKPIERIMIAKTIRRWSSWAC